MKKTSIIILIVILSIITLILSAIFIGILIEKRDFSMVPWKNNQEMGELRMNKEEIVGVEGIDKIQLSVASSDIYLHKSEDDKIKVVQRSAKELKEEEKFTLERNGSTLKIVEHVKRYFVLFSFQMHHSIYDIYIPENYSRDIKIEGASSDIHVVDALTFGNVELKSTSGDVTLQALLTGEMVNLTTVSGEVKTEAVKAKQGKLSTVSGNIDLKGLEVESYVNVDSVSGELRMTSFKGAGKLSSTSGNIWIKEALFTGASQAKTVSGNIQVLVLPENSIDVYDKTVSGKVTIDNSCRRMGKEPYQRIDLSTTSGNIALGL